MNERHDVIARLAISNNPHKLNFSTDEVTSLMPTLDQMDASLCDSNGDLRLLPASVYHAYPTRALAAWCMLKSVWQLPTLELIQWLQLHIIRGQKAIAICSGHDRIGHHLGIPMTDAFHAIRKPEYAATLRRCGIAPRPPHSDVEELEALAAIKKYKPQVVIGAWVSHVHDGTSDEGYMYGVDEFAVLRAVKTYAMIGHRKIHDGKPLRQKPHERKLLPGLVSRSMNPAGNCIYVWQNRDKR